MLRLNLCLLICLFINLLVQAQDGILFAEAWNDRAYSFYNKNADSVLVYGQKALEASEKSGYEKGKVVAMVRLGRGFAEKGDHENAKAWCAKAIEAAQKAHEPRYEASALLQLALLDLNETKYTTALEQALKALSLYENAGDQNGVITATMRIGQVYSQTKKFDKAIDIFQKGLGIATKIKDNTSVGYLNGELGTAHKNKALQLGTGDFRDAIRYFNKAATILSAQGDRQVWITYLTLSNLYAEGMQDEAKALEYTEKALQVVEKTGEPYGLGQTLTALGRRQNVTGKFAAAEDNLRQAQSLAEREEYADLLAPIYYERTLANTGLNRPDSVRFFLQAYGFALENRFVQAYSRDLNELQTKYETTKKEKELLSLRFEKDRQSLLLERRQSELLEQHLLTAQQKNEIDSLDQNAKIHALELAKSEGLIREKQLETERQSAEIKAAEGRESALRNGIFGLTGIAVALLVGIWQFLRIRRMRREQKLKLDFTRQKAELETRTLRAQMNPHFIFNALASIKKFVLTNDMDRAEVYLSKFARLIRLILENSRETLATVKSEIELLDNYIQLERLRSGDRFNYEFHIDEALDIENIEIPSLVLQPFVENAIIHGLNNRREPGGNLSVSFVQAEDDLRIVIEDNGIGRAKAEALKSPDQRLRHRSFGMDITQKRLESFASESGRKPIVQITDLENESHTSCGTRVQIEIPIYD